MPSTRFWLAVGHPENWQTATLYGGIWGLKETQRHFWDSISENRDLVFFYATTPVSGVIGYGIVRTKLRQTTPLWPDELRENTVIWPLRFEYDSMESLPEDCWRQDGVRVEELRARVHYGFQEIEQAIAHQILQSFGDVTRSTGLGAFGLRSNEPLAFPFPVQATAPDLHDRTKGLIVEIGRIQRLVSMTEFPLDNRRLDVVWRRTERAAPSHVFEVQVAGNLTEALGKLKNAADHWNSRVFLVGKEEHRAPTEQLLGGTFREIRERLRFVEIAQVEELYARKRGYQEFESQLGIFA